jgi:GTPase SAR1 family protein
MKIETVILYFNKFITRVNFTMADFCGVDSPSTFLPCLPFNCIHILVLFSITGEHSFSEVTHHIEEIYETKKSRQVPMLLVGTMADLSTERKVNEAQARKLAEKYNIEYIKTSSMTGLNVQEVRRLLNKIISHYQKMNL